MVKKIPSDDRRAMYKSSDRRVSRDELAQFVKGKHRVKGKNRWVMSTTRSDGSPSDEFGDRRDDRGGPVDCLELSRASQGAQRQSKT